MGSIFGNWGKGNIFADGGPLGFLGDGGKSDRQMGIRQGFREGLSFEEISRLTGEPIEYIRKQAPKGYGVKQHNPTRNYHTDGDYSTDAPPLNYGGSGGRGGGGGINARERDYTIGQIDEALGEYDHQLGMLNEQERIGRRDIEDGYNRNRSRLNTQHGRAMSRFATQESDNLRNFHESAEDNHMSARTNYHALQQMLGRAGAGRSSAAETLVPYAISQTASKQHGALSDDYALNARNIKTAKDETEEDYKHKVEDLGAQKNTSLRNLETDIAGKRSSIHREKGVLEGQKVQARGGNWQEAKNAMAGHKNTAQSLAASVNSLADKYRNPYSVQDVNVKKAELKNFSLDTAGISPSESKRGHDTDTSARYLKQIEEEKKRKQQAGIYGY